MLPFFRFYVRKESLLSPCLELINASPARDFPLNDSIKCFRNSRRKFQDHATIPREQRHNHFLEQVEQTVNRVLEAYPDNPNISEIHPSNREALTVARRLQAILKQFYEDDDCPRCWFKRSLCICCVCPPLEKPPFDIHPHFHQNLPSKIHSKINRIFLILHHQEICLMVDTSKLILASLPQTCRLVVAGIGPEYQDSMKELYEAMGIESSGRINSTKNRKCLVLFPAEGAKIFTDIDEEFNITAMNACDENIGWDVVVLDGTWPQARRLHNRYIPPEDAGGPPRVKLSTRDLESVAGAEMDQDGTVKNSSGRQLRKHPIKWKEIGTLEATRLLLRDMFANGTDQGTTSIAPWEAMENYQQLANAAARRHRGR